MPFKLMVMSNVALMQELIVPVANQQERVYVLNFMSANSFVLTINPLDVSGMQECRDIPSLRLFWAARRNGLPGFQFCCE